MLKEEKYIYDHKGLRIKKEEFNGPNKKSTYYVYSGNDILFTETYINDKPIDMVFNIADMASFTYHYGQDPKEELNYYYKDHRQNRVAKTEADGSIISTANKFGYSSWGELDNPGATEENWFTGKKQDDSGLYYFNARYYDADMGRFLQEDQVKYGSNWYTYCSNDPVNRIDFNGMEDDIYGELIPISSPNFPLSDFELFEGYSALNIKSLFDKVLSGKFSPDIIAKGSTALLQVITSNFSAKDIAIYIKTMYYPSLQLLDYEFNLLSKVLLTGIDPTTKKMKPIPIPGGKGMRIFGSGSEKPLDGSFWLGTHLGVETADSYNVFHWGEAPNPYGKENFGGWHFAWGSTVPFVAYLHVYFTRDKNGKIKLERLYWPGISNEDVETTKIIFGTSELLTIPPPGDDLMSCGSGPIQSYPDEFVLD